ncbi:unnamed protein product [Tilletia controversa]|nr:unnamed protein product [Tilletia controversa]CAD6969826.1 unnamed protein product [Tilletia controversa]CAD6976887.1 unnamed protein product [Tilletia controversa]
MSESRSASAGILPAKEINKGHNKPAFYGNLQRLDSYVLEHSSRVRIAVVPTRPELPIGSATTLLKEQAEDVWSIGLLSLALFCGMRTPIGGIFGSLLKEGNLSGLGPEDADLEAELFDIIASLRQSEDLTLFGPASQSNMPHMSRHFAELLVQVLQSLAFQQLSSQYSALSDGGLLLRQRNLQDWKAKTRLGRDYAKRRLPLATDNRPGLE